MGVFHLSGLGLSPGAITVPLTYIYLSLKAAEKGHKRAEEFFAYSGEKGQQFKGAPEVLILFTSEEVITGKKEGRPFIGWKNKTVRDNWFQTKKKENIPKTIAAYLLKLYREYNIKKYYDSKWIKNIYFVEVDPSDFNNCFRIIGPTFGALKSKEIWVNMIGGTNQINISLFIGGTFSATSTQYYYVFQNDISMLHPDTEKPGQKDPSSFVDKYLKNWHAIPIFSLEIGEILKRINELFIERDIINIGQLERHIISYTSETDLNERSIQSDFVRKTILSKLRSGLLIFDNDKVRKGPKFDYIMKLKEIIDDTRIRNFSDWLKWAASQQILWETDIETGNTTLVQK